MSEWISVKDNLPSQDTDIIVSGKHSCKIWCTQIYHEYIDGNPTNRILDWSTYRDTEITHCMPLPEIPNETSN